MKKIHYLVITLVLSPMLLLSLNLTGEEPDKVSFNKALMIALDISGSMAGEPLRKVKDVIVSSVGRMSSQAVIGLITYSGCGSRSVRVRVPLARKGLPNFGSKEDVIKYTERAYARNGTDIYTALKKAEKEINKLPPGWCTKVLLLSDGADSCALGDYKKVIKRITRDNGGCNNTIDVISLNVPFWDRDLLDGIGEEGGGTHIAVDTEDDLRNAIEDLIIDHKRPIEWEGETPFPTPTRTSGPDEPPTPDMTPPATIGATIEATATSSVGGD